MLQLNVWLRFRGKQIQEELWEIQLYDRIYRLLSIWEGAWVYHPKHQHKIIISHDFNGELLGSWKQIENELEQMDLGAYDMCMTWKTLSPTDKEKDIIDNILLNVTNPPDVADVI